MEFQRESIFVSALRGFCNSLFIVFGIFAALIIISCFFAAFAPSYKFEQKTSVELLPDLNWKKELAPANAPVVLQIDIRGFIGNPEQIDSKTMEAILIDSRQGLLQHDRVKAVLLFFNTGGGSALDSDNIYRQLMQYKQKFNVPVYAYVEGICASGGMYIAAAADKIYASPSSILGSIGVYSGPYFNVVDALTRIGVQTRMLTEGIDKYSMGPFKPWKPDEDQNLQSIQVYLYNRFVDVMTKSRPNLDKTKLVQEYGAKIFDPVRALEYGYIDVADADYSMTLTDLLTAANIDPSKPYQVVELKPRKGFLSDLVQGNLSLFTGKVKHSLDVSDEYQMKEPFAYLYRP